MITKTPRELAYLHELFVATDWGGRFGELLDEHVKIPKKGKVLYLGAGTGAHAIALQERSSDALEFTLVEENAESLDLAKAKATALGDSARFEPGSVDHLTFPDNTFAAVIGDGSLVPESRIPAMMSEMVRVAATDAIVALVVPTLSSFGEFFSIYWEALYNAGLIDHESAVERLITKLPSVSAMEGMSEQSGLEDVTSWTTIEEIDYESGEAFLSAPLIADFLMPRWLGPLPENHYERVTKEIKRIINEERHESEFPLTFKATLILGRKALLQ